MSPSYSSHSSLRAAADQSDVRFDGILDDEPDPSWQGELLSVPIEGSTLGKTVLFHERSGALISADVIENVAESSDWVTRAYLKAGGIYGKPGLHPLLRLSYRDKKSARRSFDRLLELPIGPIALAHGAPLLADGLQATTRCLVPIGRGSR
jgi:hypothetical protein